jgi:type I restriction enzyme M protein
MDPSLGNKRNEIGDGEDGKPNQINEITRIYGNFTHDEKRVININGKPEEIIVSKIFDNEDFGYWRITVERPLRLNFKTSDERIKRLDEERSFINLAISKKKGSAAQSEINEGRSLQNKIRELLKTIDQNRVFTNREEFERVLVSKAENLNIFLYAPLKKSILNALSEQDDNADICIDHSGNPEPDTDLRDYENVPIKQDIQKFFEEEVLPHVPNAWIEESRTSKGYEINFSRYFYQYKPLREPSVIENEIKNLEKDLDGLLEEVFKS